METMTLNDLVKDTIEADLRNLAGIEPGSEEHTRAVKDIATLYNLTIDEYKAMSDAISKDEQFKEKLEQEKDEAKKLRYIEIGKIAKDVGIFAASMAFTLAITKIGLKFEETGSVTSFFNRSMIPRLLPKIGK